MTDVFRTMILESDDVALGRAIANMFAGSDQHMWQTGLSSDGLPPATHYISTGYVPEGYQVMTPWQIWEQNPETGEWKLVDSYPGRPDIVYGACQQAQPPVECTLQDIEGLYARADITPQDPWVAMGRLGLQMVQQQQPEPAENPSF